MGTLILIKCTYFDPYLMAMHVRTEGDILVFFSEKMRLLLILFESKPHIIIIFHLKTDKEKLEKHHVNGSQTRNIIFIMINEPHRHFPSYSVTTTFYEAPIWDPYGTHTIML